MYSYGAALDNGWTPLLTIDSQHLYHNLYLQSLVSSCLGAQLSWKRV